MIGALALLLGFQLAGEVVRLAMGLNGLLTAVALPAILPWLGRLLGH